MLVGADDGAIDMVQVPVKAPLGVGVLLEAGQHGVEDAGALPQPEAAVDCLPGAIALGYVAPGGAGAQDPEHGAEHEPMVLGGAPPPTLSLGQQGADALPLRIGQFSPTHRGSLRVTARFPDMHHCTFTSQTLGFRQLFQLPSPVAGTSRLGLRRAVPEGGLYGGV